MVFSGRLQHDNLMVDLDLALSVAGILFPAICYLPGYCVYAVYIYSDLSVPVFVFVEHWCVASSHDCVCQDSSEALIYVSIPPDL